MPLFLDVVVILQLGIGVERGMDHGEMVSLAEVLDGELPVAIEIEGQDRIAAAVTDERGVKHRPALRDPGG